MSVIDRAFLDAYARTDRFRNGLPRSFSFLPTGDILFLRSKDGRSRVLSLYLWKRAERREVELATADFLLQGGAEGKLAADEKGLRERLRLTAGGIVSYRLFPDCSLLLIPLSGELFVLELGSRAVAKLPSLPSPALFAQISPDGRTVACVVDRDIWTIDFSDSSAAPSVAKQLTFCAREEEKGVEEKKKKGKKSCGKPEFVAMEEMDRFEGFWFSPDGKRICFQETDESSVETLYIHNAALPCEEAAGFPYPRAGKNNAVVRLGIISLDEEDRERAWRSVVWVDWDREAYPYVATVRWATADTILLLVQNREQQDELLLAVDPATGKTRTVLRERSNTWLNLDQTMPIMLDRHHFLWSAEREDVDGWVLELYHLEDGFVRRLTGPNTAYRNVLSVSRTADGPCIFVAGGSEPTEQHIFRISLPPNYADRKAPVKIEQLTSAAALHNGCFSNDGVTWVHEEHSLTDWPKWTVQRIGEERPLGIIESRQEAPKLRPRVEVFTVKHERQFRAAVVLPTSFDPCRKYPVIVHVYAGPHVRYVTASLMSYVFLQWMAEHGFVVCVIDGRGTPFRGTRWERAIRGNFIRVPLEDQVAGLQAIAHERPYMDMTRVGIEGWSFGGYFSAMAPTLRPDVYHAGFAGAPVCSWEWYDTHYTERYLGLPSKNPVGYKDSDFLTHASKLTRPLFIAHGLADDNVFFCHAVQMSNALFRNARPHDFLPLVGFTHVPSDPTGVVALYSRMLGFFIQHLCPSDQPSISPCRCDCPTCARCCYGGGKKAAGSAEGKESRAATATAAAVGAAGAALLLKFLPMLLKRA